MKVSRFSLPILLALGFSSLSLACEQVDLSDVGDVCLENAGKPEAQQAFLHGLAQLHNFEFDFAARDFQEAQQIDHDFALAYWGEAMSYNHPLWAQQDKTSALVALNKYEPSADARQEKAPTALTRDLFAAVDILYGSGSKQDQDDLYNDHMAMLFARYPDNVEVAAFYALSIMGTAHEGRDFSLYMQSAAIMQNFMTEYPRHPGVAHYLIHSTDDPIHAPLGLQAANAYGDIAPNAAHAQHMTTHIFLALGDWDGVIRANIRASEITNENRAARGEGPAGCGHYPSWLMYGYLQQGERDAAYDIMNLCYKNVASTSNGRFRNYYVWQRMLYLLDTGEWNGDVADMRVDLGDNLEAFFQNQIVDGWVAVKRDDIKGARKHLNGARGTFSRLEKSWDEDGVTDISARKKPGVLLMQLESQIQLATGNNESALKLLRDVVDIEMELPYGFGPPRPAKPSLELLGETLVELGQIAEAKTVLEANLGRTPNKALTIAALAAANTKLASAD